MLKVNNLTIKYDRTILDDVSVSFPRGTVTVIRGASGSGKSSLLNVLGLIKKPNKECAYSLDDEAIDLEDEKKASDFRLKRVGFVFQENNLIQELTAMENIMVPARMLSKDKAVVKEKAQRFIEYVGLDSVADSYPSSLSGGEEQRVAIARALMNDVDIILADEPTTSLDAGNSGIILRLFKKLAHELNKIVIIVSHDDKVSEMADTVYEIKEYKLILAQGGSITMKGKAVDKKAADRKSIFSFINYYTWRRKKEKKLSGVLIVVTAIFAAVTTLFVNLGGFYNGQQKEYVNAISERSLFLINGAGRNKECNHFRDYRISDEEIQKIREIPNVDKVYPFYEFTSTGNKYDYTLANKNEDTYIALIDGNQIIRKIPFKNPTSYIPDNPTFSVVPLYTEEDINEFLEYGRVEANVENGFILSEALAKDLSDNPLSLVGKMLEVKCHVPTKLFDIEVTSWGKKPIIRDFTVDKPIIIEKEIKGILSSAYSYGKTEQSKNLILLDYNVMEKILNENKNTNYDNSFGNPQSEFKPCAVNVYTNSFEDIPEVWSKIGEVSSSFAVVSNITDIKNIKSELRNMRNFMWGISSLLIVIVMVMFYFVYFLKSRTRKKEIGILKAIGMTSGDVIALISWETILSSLMTFICSLVMAVLLKTLGSNIKFEKIPDFQTVYSKVIASFTSPASLSFLLFLTFFIVIASSIASIWRASRIDIIDAIRNNK